MTTSTHKGLLWDDRNVPNGLPIFAIFPYSSLSPQDSEREIIASLKVTHDNHLDDDDVRTLAKKSYHFPNNFPEMETMLSTFVSVLTVLLGPQSLVAQLVKSVLTHLDQNHDPSNKSTPTGVPEYSSPLTSMRCPTCVNSRVQSHWKPYQPTTFNRTSYAFLMT
jgi:hypothetical protein